MEIFGVPVYLNFLSVVCFVPCVLCVLGTAFVGLIRQKSQNSWLFLVTCAGGAVFQLGYTIATSTLASVGAYHRWLTVFSVFFMLWSITSFYLSYGEITNAKLRRFFSYLFGFFVPVMFVWFATKSMSAQRIFRLNGQWWDFDMVKESAINGAAILLLSVLGLCAAIHKYRKMRNRRAARAYLIIIALGYIYMVPNASLNFL